MTFETLEQLGSGIDDAFFLIAAAILGIELLKAAFTKSLGSRGLLDMLASVSTQVPYLLAEIFLLSFVYAAFVTLGDRWVSWTFPTSMSTVVLAVVAADFVYYWEHRIAHQVRVFWTQHAVHHSSRYMNIVVGIRFGPLESVLSAILHFPLVLLGFPPELVFFGIIVVLAYQSWIHTEVIGRLGPLDAVLNTPSNHRVHHGCDEKYIDKNYGGILMIWDRLFGTYQREEETPNYGLARDYDSVNPLSVWFSELPTLFRDLRASQSWREWWHHFAGRPGKRLEIARSSNDSIAPSEPGNRAQLAAGGHHSAPSGVRDVEHRAG